MKRRSADHAVTCPTCEKRVSGEPESCPHCAQTLLHTCLCGASWHLASLKCPECGQTHSFRRRVRRRFYTKRRFRLLGVLLLLVVLVGVNVFLIFSRSPSRRKHEFLMEGYRAYERDDYGTAGIRFERYLEMEPGAVEVRYMLGLTRFHLGETDRAIEALERVTLEDPDFALAHAALADHHLRSGNLREALRRAEMAVRRDPAPGEAWRVLGAVRLELRDHEGAIKALTEAAEVMPDPVETHLTLGDLYFSREVRGLEDVNEGLARSRYEKAASIADRILDEEPDRIDARIWLVKAYAGQGGEKLALAIQRLEGVVEDDPGEPGHRLLLARLHGAREDHEAESAVLLEAWSETPSPKIATHLARALSEFAADPAGGREALERGIEMFGSDPGLRISLAAHHRRQREYGDARRVLDEALAEFPSDASVAEADGDLHLAVGDVEKAAVSYRSALELRSQSPSALRKLVAILLPRAVEALEDERFDAKEVAEVRRHIATFLHPETGLNPRDPHARMWRARLAFAERDYESASQILGELEGMTGETYERYRILGFSRLQSGDYPGASSALAKALAHPDCPRTPDDFHLAYSASLRAGHARRQTEICRGALERWPQDADWRLRLAASLFRNDRAEEALRECGKAKTLLLGTRNVQPHLLAARIHQARGDTSRARRELEDAVDIRRDPQTRGALYAFFASIGEMRLAEAGFEALNAERPEDPEVALRYGDHLLRQSRSLLLSSAKAKSLERDALTQYERVLALDPGSREALHRVAELRIEQAASSEAAVAAAEDAVASIEEGSDEDPYLFYFRGKLHLLRKEYGAARDLLLEYARRNPNDPAGLYYLGIAFRRSGDLSRAKAQFVAALSLDRGMWEAKLQLATLHFTEGMRARWNKDYDEARAAFERVVAIDPRQPETRRFLAEIFTQLGMSERAVEEAERVLEARPDDPGALFLSGLLRARRSDFEVARTRFARLTELFPDNPFGHLYLGVVLAEMREFDAGRDEIIRAYRLSPDSDEVLRAIVLCEVAAERADEVLLFVERERERSPDRPAVHTHLGWLYRRVGRLQDAVRAYRTAFQLEPEDAASLAMAAAILADEGRLEEAIDILDEGAGRSPVPARLLLLKGRLLLEEGEVRDGEDALRRSILADPESPEAYRELGLLLIRGERLTEGEAVLRDGLRRGLEDPAVHFRLAYLAERQGRNEEAVRHYREVLALRPAEAAAQNNLAALLSASTETLPEAIELARKARSLLPGDPRVADTLGWALFLDGKHEQAAEMLAAAAAELSEDPMVQHHAGMACHYAYRWEEAAKFLEAALALSPDHPEAGKAREILELMR